VKRLSVVEPLLVGLSLAPIGALALVLFAQGCSNHDGLAPGPDAGTSSHSASSSKSASSASGTGGAAPVEPDGPTRLTLIDAVVDAPSVAFCFASYPSGASTAAPFPSGGLGFAKALVVPLPATDIPTGDVLLTIVSGDLTSVGSATCGEITADPTSYPALVVTSLGVLPADTLTAKRSLLLAPMGCIGGPTHTDANQEAVCGKGYTPDNPTVTLLAGPLSRLDDPARIALQAVNATTVVTKADIYFRPGFDGLSDNLLESKLSSGGVGPFPPYTGLTAASIGSVATAEIGIAPNPSSAPLANKKKLSDALANAGLVSTDLLNGKGFALVACGASPAVGSGSWWNDFAFVAVSTDPMP